MFAINHALIKEQSIPFQGKKKTQDIEMVK